MRAYRDAAARELAEETGLKITSGLDDLMCTEHYPPRPVHEYPASLSEVSLENFAAEAAAGWSPRLDAEHTEHRWAAFEEADGLLRFDAARAALAIVRRAVATGRRLEIWSRLRSRTAEVEALLARIADEALQTRCEGEGWSIELIGCHIALGLRRQAKWIELALIGRPPHRFDWDRSHALNALVARRFSKPGRAEVLHALRAGSRRWRELLARASDADLGRIAFEHEGNERSVDWVSGVLAPRHVDEHLRSIRAALGEADRA